jgi:hypothetical protein
MNMTVQAVKEKHKELSPKTGGRGAENKDQPRDKGIRIRSALYKKLVRLGNVENDLDDIISMLYEYWKKDHKEYSIEEGEEKSG